MALPSLGASGDITIANIIVADFNDDQTFARVTIPADAVSGADPYDVWLPNDDRVTSVPSLPANWPPQEGDVWTLAGTGIKSCVMKDPANQLYFVTADNFIQHQTPLTVEQGLALYGSSLEMLTRIPTP